MVGHILVLLAFVQNFQIGLDEGDSATEEKRNLPGLHLLACELGTTSEGG